MDSPTIGSINEGGGEKTEKTAVATITIETESDAYAKSLTGLKET